MRDLLPRTDYRERLDRLFQDDYVLDNDISASQGLNMAFSGVLEKFVLGRLLHGQGLMEWGVRKNTERDGLRRPKDSVVMCDWRKITERIGLGYVPAYIGELRDRYEKGIFEIEDLELAAGDGAAIERFKRLFWTHKRRFDSKLTAGQKIKNLRRAAPRRSRAREFIEYKFDALEIFARDIHDEELKMAMLTYINTLRHFARSL